MSGAIASNTPTVVERLAELTRHRDRDLLDVMLAGAFRDLLRPRCVSVVRKVGEAGDERWMTRAKLGASDVAASSDVLWADHKDLPRLADHPSRYEALKGNCIATSRDGLHLTVFPLATERDVAGVVEIESDSPLDHDAHRIVISMLHVYRNFEGLLDYSERDTLTGLLNRKTFDESFLKIVSASASPAAPVPNERRAPGSHDPYWVAMIDIDHFKSVNDRFGHLIGDEVLLLQARLMLTSFRFYDRLYRFGGEEFVVLMRCPTESDAARVFERLRANTEKYYFPQVGKVTISIGFTEVLPDDSPSSALNRADQGVYFAKSHGRNQVHGYADLVRRGAIQTEKKHVGEIDLF